MSDQEDLDRKPKNRTLCCRVGGIDVDETIAKVLWPMYAMNPISYEDTKRYPPKLLLDSRNPSPNIWPRLFIGMALGVYW